MSRASDRRKGRQSTARRRAETHASGYSTTTLKLPDGVSFFEAGPGTHVIDIVPFIAKKGNPFADAGQLHYERTFFTYRKIGPDEKSYVCSSKTFGKPDYIQDYRKRESRKSNSQDQIDYLKSLEPKERQLFLVYDRKNKEKGLQLWECSYHTFGKLLDKRIQNSPEERGWDLFYYPDEGGFTLEVTISEENGGGYKFNDTTAIDFIERDDPLPEDIQNHGLCLDDFLIETPYDVLRDIFMGIANTDEEASEGSDDKQTGEREERGRTRRDEGKKEEDVPFETESKKDTVKDEPKKEEKKSEDPRKTATDLGLHKDVRVGYHGRVFTIFKVTDEGRTLTLIDAEDDLVKAVPVGDVAIFKEESKKDTVKEEPKKEEKKSESSKDEEDWDADWDDK